MAVEERETTTEEEAAPALSVSAAMGLAKNALEEVVVRLVGEVSEVNDKPGYKAVYFTVKDEKASLPCMMWMNRYQASGVALSVGALVELTGRFSLYAAKGRMNFDVFSVSLAGEGQLRLQVANLARELEAMGLMDPARKRPLPAYPETIGLVTPPRGGGSFEDLMPFNDRRLARTIAACPVPVVTGIGHEPDTSIADMVADVRASTPTAAAEAVAPAQGEIAARIQGLGAAMGHAEGRRLDGLSLAVERLASLPLFREPTRLFDAEALALDDLSDRLGRALPAALTEDRHRLGLIGEALGRMLPGLLSAPRAAVGASAGRLGYLGEHFGERPRQRLEGARGRLERAGAAMTDPYRASVAVSAARLHDLSPLAIIGRGYAMAKGEDGRVVSSVDGVAAGERLVVTLSDGELDCTVDDIRRIHSAVEAWD